MDRFRKKPVVIDAIQFVETGRTKRKYGDSVEFNSADVATFIGRPIRICTSPDGTPEGRTFIEIETLEGVMEASVNDWIIRGVMGEFYPCKPDIFEATYEKVV